MSRQPRLNIPGLVYHIMARGIERRVIFSDKRDYAFFLNRLDKILSEIDADCLAFALLPNHFHLLMRFGNASISTMMRRLLTSYALFFNRRHRRAGHLFQNRYKSIICQEGPYLLELIRYIHLNPIRAGITKSLSELNLYPYAGHSALLGKTHFDWYQPDVVLSYFGCAQKKAVEKYMKFVSDGFSMGENHIYVGSCSGNLSESSERHLKERQITTRQILGAEDFIRSLQEHAEKEKQKEESQANIEELSERVAMMYSLKPKQISGRGRVGKVNEARALLAHLAVSYLGFSFADTARYLKVHRSTSARMAERGREIAKTVQVERGMIVKGQQCN